MKKLFIVTVIFFFVLPTDLLAQKKRSLSDKDKQTIVDIFRQLRAPYCLVFNRTEYYGKKDVIYPGLGDIENKSSGQAAGYFFSNHPEISMWYIVQTGAGQPQTLEDVFGKTNATKLQAIINKYSGGS